MPPPILRQKLKPKNETEREQSLNLRLLHYKENSFFFLVTFRSLPPPFSTHKLFSNLSILINGIFLYEGIHRQTCRRNILSYSGGGINFNACPSVRPYVFMGKFTNWKFPQFNFILPQTNTMKLIHNANYHQTEIKLKFGWHHFHRSSPFVNGKNVKFVVYAL